MRFTKLIVAAAAAMMAAMPPVTMGQNMFTVLPCFCEPIVPSSASSSAAASFTTVAAAVSRRQVAAISSSSRSTTNPFSTATLLPTGCCPAGQTQRTVAISTRTGSARPTVTGTASSRPTSVTTESVFILVTTTPSDGSSNGSSGGLSLLLERILASYVLLAILAGSLLGVFVL